MAVRYQDSLFTWAWWVRRLLPLVGLGWAVLASGPYPTWPGATAVIWCALPLSAAGWLLWQFGPPTGPVVWLAGGLSIGVGLVLAVVHPHSPTLAFPAVGCLQAAWRLRPARSIPLVLAAAVLFVPGAWLVDGPGFWLLIGPGGIALGTMAGLIRRQNTQLADETRLAREEQAHSAALDERARIAREIHDVLAHSLAALAVQLETADALLESGRAEQARQSVIRAGRLAREGLAETRRAIGALRGETLPLSELLDNLATGYRTDLVAPARVEVAGPVRELDADTTLALYRSAQEAVTNVRKHAPGARVTLDLRYEPKMVVLSVVNGAPPDDVPRPLADAGGGWGLAGLRERAELAGGTFRAGPADGGYRVDVTIPT